MAWALVLVMISGLFIVITLLQVPGVTSVSAVIAIAALIAAGITFVMTARQRRS